MRVSGDRADRAAAPVAEDAVVTVEAGPRFVSRGGEKLEGALDDFGVDVARNVALDVGSSTGGFTDCLLQRGASRVYAVDVGKGQLEWKLRNDERVRVMEGINAREGFDLPEPVGPHRRRSCRSSRCDSPCRPPSVTFATAATSSRW